VTELAIVFDLDGTLIDSRRDIAGAIAHMLAVAGRPALSEETILGFVGDGARHLVASVLGVPFEAPEVDGHLAIFIDHYTAHPVARTTLMPGTLEALTALAEFPLALCTNKARRTTDAVLRGLDLERHFEVVVAGDDTVHRKPHPAPLQSIAAQLGVPTTQLVMVGDGPQDVECGHAVGAHTVGLEGGILPIERLLAARPHTMLRSLHDLPQLVRQLHAARRAH
jgi:phosphoglycolate phosphatase